MRTSRDPIINRMLALIPAILEAERTHITDYEVAEFALADAAYANRHLDLAYADFAQGSETSQWMPGAFDGCRDFATAVRRGHIPPHIANPLIKQLQLKIEAYQIGIQMNVGSQRVGVVA